MHLIWAKQVLFMLILLSVSHISNSSSPEQVAKLLADRLLSEQSIIDLEWDYGSAVILDGLLEANKIFGWKYEGKIGEIANRIVTKPGSYGDKILHADPVPWDTAVGDGIGLFPIALLDLLPYMHGENATLYQYLVGIIADKYVYKWPLRLQDGALSRNDSGDWRGVPKGKGAFVWADDSYMGLALLSRLAGNYKDLELATYVLKQAVLASEVLQDTKDGLFWHGYDALSQAHSCCKWGRGNGWIIMSHVELLVQLQNVSGTSSLWSNLKSIFQQHVEGISNCQTSGGLWHQVLDVPSTYEETSVTAMTLYSLALGWSKGLLEHSSSLNATIYKAWQGLKGAVNRDGSVSGICCGTGIQSSAAGYQLRPTLYFLSKPGLGSVLKAAVAMKHLEQ